MKYSRWGLEMRAIGGNPQAARRNGIPLKAYLVSVMCLGGAIAGLAGMALVSGYYGLLLANFSTGYGYMGFLISWLSFGNPVGILLVSFLVAVITTGGNLLQLTQGAAVCRDQHPAGAVSLYRSGPSQILQGSENIMTLLAILGVISSAIYSGTSCCMPRWAKSWGNDPGSSIWVWKGCCWSAQPAAWRSPA